MSDDRPTITIHGQGFAAIVDAVERAIVDKGASRATRKAAFSALLALVEAGLIIGDMSIGSPASDKKGSAPAHVSARLRPTG